MWQRFEQVDHKKSYDWTSGNSEVPKVAEIYRAVVFVQRLFILAMWKCIYVLIVLSIDLVTRFSTYQCHSYSDFSNFLSVPFHFRQPIISLHTRNRETLEKIK
jgi:hypothetical protein